MRVAKHSILVELGRGGMADVYLAVARGPGDFNKLVVHKRLRADLARDPSFREMALGEAKIAARLNHPNVVQTYEILNEGERPVIVMEYLEGQSLASVLACVHEGSFTVEARLRVLADALAGLHHAHELTDFDGRPFGLVHRDFTPHNIFLGYDGHVKVLDFGIAQTTSSHTDPGTFKGKARYVAPEQIAATSVLDRRADIFSAGMVLWELATGESPWKRTPDITIINRVIHGQIPSIRAVAPTVRDDIEQICNKAIQFDRDKRFATAAEMEAAIEQVLSTMSVRVAPREIGRIVADHFGDVRAVTKRVIEEQLAKLDAHGQADEVPVLPLIGVDGDTQSAAEVETNLRSRQLWVGLSIAGAAAGCAAVLALLGRHPRSEAPPTPITMSAMPESATRAPESTRATNPRVEIRVRVVPGSATIFFDLVRLPTNPAVVVRVADGSLHTVRAEARGYASRSVQIVVDSGADLVLTLERAPGVPNPPVPSEHPSARGSAMPPTMAPADCNPPFYIDEDGIKKFKAQCI